MSKDYISCADTAKLVRQALKESFPTIKFGVRSKTYSGGASIDVSWVDGPTSEQVKRITNAFEGAYFDGMIDHKGSIYHRLDGQPVQFMANFIFERREHSDAAIMHALGRVCREYHLPYKAEYVADYRNGKLYGIQLCNGANPDAFLREVDKALREWSKVEAKPSPTLARVEFAGSDEYGAPYGSRGYPNAA